MDDTQLDNEQAGTAAPADAEKPSEAEEAKTETGEDAEPKADAGDDAGEDKGEGDESEKSDDEEKKPKKPSGSERLKRRVEALQRENENLRSRVGDGEITQDAVERVIGKPPKEEDYKGDFLAYERALTATN